jgi:protein-tyrosine phosphatase
MFPDLYWIETRTAGRLAVMPRPRAGDWLEDEIAGWRIERIETVVSLLEASEVAELGLVREAELCRHHAIEFVSFPIPDRGVPASLSKAADLARSIALEIASGKAIAVHCRAGIGRSALIAACVLVCSGFNPTAAFDAISMARGTGVPDTDLQRAWVATFYEAVAKTR